MRRLGGAGRASDNASKWSAGCYVTNGRVRLWSSEEDAKRMRLDSDEIQIRYGYVVCADRRRQQNGRLKSLFTDGW